MTTDEIKAMRQELECAIYTACKDFHRLTDVCVIDIRIETELHYPLSASRPEQITTGVTVVLESL
jgi:hypothetical protein